VLFQINCDGGILFNLPLHLTFEQLGVDRLSGKEESAQVVITYSSVGVVQEILQGIVGFSKRLLENFG
jgi:hypothetical protein